MDKALILFLASENEGEPSFNLGYIFSQLTIEDSIIFSASILSCAVIGITAFG